MMKSQQQARLFSFLLGFISLTVQILFLRELVTVFYGNEMAYAVIMGSWLFWVSLGAFLSGWLVRRIKQTYRFVCGIQFLIIVFLPLSLGFIRMLKVIMQIPSGQMVGVLPMFLSSFIVVAPLTFLFGSLYSFLCYFYENTSSSEAPSIYVSQIYLWESIGAMTGGLAYSFILIHLLSTVQIISVMVAAGVVLLLWISADPRQKKRVLIWKIILWLIIVFVFGLGFSRDIDLWTRKIQWQGLKVVDVKDSIYGNIVVTQKGPTYSVFENGLLAFSSGDAMTSEEAVHFPLLEHPSPRRVLLVGHGLAGPIKEILKHPSVRQVDYVELDPAVIDMVKKDLPPEDWEELSDPRVNLILSDARFYIKRTHRIYDVCIINLSDPQTALINRYYTEEFFKEVKRVLSPKGLLSLGVSSSENYINTETRDFLRSIHSTLKSVFAGVVSIPGDTNIFIASPTDGSLSVDVSLFIQRLKERDLRTQYISEYYLPFRLSQDRLESINTILKEKGRLNTDEHPLAYLLDINLWSTHFNMGFKNFIEKIEGLRLRHLMAIPLLILCLGFLFKKRYPRLPIQLSITLTGFSEIVFQILVIMAFQSLYGYVYYKVGLIMASFMMGLCFGCAVAIRMIRSNSVKDIWGFYKTTQVMITLYPLIIPVVFVLFQHAVVDQRLNALMATVFAFLPLVAGFIGGIQYPLATQLIALDQPGEKRLRISQSASWLYAMDVLGAMVGALLAGAILIPLIGINAVAYFCCAINFVIWVLLMGGRGH